MSPSRLHLVLAPCAALTIALPSLAAGGVVRGWGLNTDDQVTIPSDTNPSRQVAAGSAFSIALLSDGTIRCWGLNNAGVCDVPTSLGLAKFIAAGSGHALAIENDGTVVCWGENGDGQCTVPSDLAEAKAVAGGGSHSMALSTVGAVRCWGLNTDGQCTVPGGLGAVDAIAAGSIHSVALRSTGVVVCWGSDASGQSTVPSDLGNCSAIAAGDAHTLAVNELGEVRCWGSNADGQCSPPGGLEGVTAVAAGGSHSVALKSDGTVVCWGADGDGQSTVPVDLEPVTGIAAGGQHTLAVEADPTDCNDNGVPDEIDIANDPSLDCGDDGVIDSCVAETLEEFSEETAPFGTGDTVALVINDSPTPLLPVEIEITVKADLGSSLEYLVLSLNDVDIDYIFNAGGKDCPESAQVCKLYLPVDDYVALLDEDRNAAFELRASSFVSEAECASSFASMAVRFRTDSADCNGNGLPDVCEVASGDVADDDGDGVPDTCQKIVRGDQNRDGKCDLVFYNPSTRRIVNTYLDGETTTGPDAIETTVGNGYTAVAQGDLDGDGQPDFVLRSTTTGLTYGWLMDGLTVSNFGQIGYALNGTRYTVLTMADVDGDGDDDILWLDGNDKKVYAWRVAGTVLVGGGLLASSDGSTFAGAGDVDDDGDDDLLFKNNTTGITSCWVMEDGAVSLNVPVSGGAALPSQWQGRGMADVNGDGKEDLFWRNSTTGALFVWYMDGTNQVGGGQVGYNPGPSVDLVTIGDVDGDGDPDLLWKAPAGTQVFVWILDERSFVSGGLLTTLPSGVSVLAP